MRQAPSLLDLLARDGRIAEIGPHLHGSEVQGADQIIEADGGALIPGLIDHHIHLLALAAQFDTLTLDLDSPDSPESFARRLRAAAHEAPGRWLRATGYDEAMAGPLDRASLDRLAPDLPVRIQHRTGALWLLNSAALTLLLADGSPTPDGLERKGGVPTGRLFRGDYWLTERLGSVAPDLAAVGADLSRYGVTAVTDASAVTDAARATTLADAHRKGDIPQRLNLMSGGPLAVPDDDAYAVGPVKLLLDDADLPAFDIALDKVRAARRQARSLAVHCVTDGELAFALALWSTEGALPADRIEHGGVVHPEAAAEIAGLGLTVVTQPNFIRERGDRYLATVDPRDLPALYPCASLLRAGVQVAAGSDAPYGSADPWAAIEAAVARTTRDGHLLGPAERIAARRALGLYLGCATAPGGPERRVEVGAAADLCLLDAPLREVLAAPSAERVQATIVNGVVIHAASNPRPSRSTPAGGKLAMVLDGVAR
jgi:predicted amidohydrolase YtcJ